MANISPNIQGPSHPTPTIPLIVRSAGRQQPQRNGLRRGNPPANVVISHAAQETSGIVPEPIPPHPPLLSGGWYRGLSWAEMVGPGRYPLDTPADRPAGLAVALSLVGGPVGLCYASVIGGLISTVLAVVGLVAFGFGALLVIWPLSILWAAISMHRRQQRYNERQ